MFDDQSDVYGISDTEQDHIGQMWTVPFDGRLPLGLSSSTIEVVSPSKAEELLQLFTQAHRDLTRDTGCVRVQDYIYCTGHGAVYEWRPRVKNDISGTKGIPARMSPGEYYFNAEWFRHMYVVTLII